MIAYGNKIYVYFKVTQVHITGNSCGLSTVIADEHERMNGAF